MRTRRTWVAGLVAAVVLGTAGCSMLDSADSTEVHLVQVSHDPLGDPASVHVAHVDRVSASATEWTVRGVDPAGTTITMYWVDGVSPECGEVNRVEVAERASTVTVGLSDTANDPHLVCAAVGALHHFELHLKQPLAGRALLEPVTGVNDGLPHFRSGTPPLPTCSTNANPTDVPVGMPEAAARLAPPSATHVSICRTAWPHGSARTSAAQLSDPAAIHRLVRVLNEATHPRPLSSARPACETSSRGSRYAIYLTGPHTQVEVLVDEIDCATVTNGALLATATPAIRQTLDRYFQH